MRYPILCALALGVATAPLAGQVQDQQMLSIDTGDTTVVIKRGDQNSCTVVIDGRALADSAAKRICNRAGRNIAWNRSRLAPDSAFGSLNLERRLAGPGGVLRLFPGLDTLVQSRVVIGVTVDTRARETDRYGAYVAGVTPSGPADQAGLQSGDIITSLAGTSLTSGATRQAVGADESRPYVRLIERIATVEAGKPIRLEFRRGDANRSATITPRSSDQVFAFGAAVPLEGFDSSAKELLSTVPWRSPSLAGVLRRGDRTSDDFSVGPYVDGVPVAFSSVLRRTELAPMNEKLGRYFGTSSGVLIISSGEDNPLGLVPGDVVQSVDGREVRSPNELGRILRSYTTGDRISIGITRDQKSQTLSAELP